MVAWSVKQASLVVDCDRSFHSLCIVVFVHSLHLSCVNLVWFSTISPSLIRRLRNNSYTVFARLVLERESGFCSLTRD